MDSAGAWLPPNFRFPATLAAGQVYESMGRREAATRSYAAAMAESRRRQLAAPEDHQNEAALALAAAGLGHAAEAVAHGRRAVELLPVSKDAAEGPLYLYLLAQVQARVGDHAGAFATLDELFSVPGFYNERWVQRDPGFASLWRHPCFRRILRAGQNSEAPCSLAPGRRSHADRPIGTLEADLVYFLYRGLRVRRREVGSQSKRHGIDFVAAPALWSDIDRLENSGPVNR